MAPDDEIDGSENSQSPNEPNARNVLDALNRQTRILHEAWMLPPQGTQLTAEQIDEVRQAFQRHIKSVKLSVAKAAPQTGYSSSVLSDWCSGKYAGDSSAVAHAVNSWIARDKRRHNSKLPADYVPTQVAEDMRSVIITADSTGRMAAIVAPSGSGKSFVLKSMIDELNAIYLLCDSSMKSPKGFIDKLALRLFGKPTKGTLGRLLDACVNKLAEHEHVLMIDEADRLGPSAMSIVRSIYDQAHITIVIAGTADILKSVNDQADGRGQFSRRCLQLNVMDYVHDVTDPTRGGGKSASGSDRDLFSVEEVRAFFASKRMKLHRDALDMLATIASIPGFGSLGRIYEIARSAAKYASDEERESISKQDVITSCVLEFGRHRFPYVQNLIKRHVSTRQQQAEAVEALATA